MMTSLCIIVFCFAAVPTILFFINLLAYRVPQSVPENISLPAVSVLIPARNEEGNIAAAIKSVQANERVRFEILVLDDNSTDRTAEIVHAMALDDPRIQLMQGDALPHGWCGKQYACSKLAEAASNPVLIFMDADVRLSRDALSRMTHFIQSRGVQLASGVPRQETVTFLERLLIPLIHFVLLGFLPIHRMQRSLSPKYAAGCGQLFVADRSSYFEAGGHAAIRDSVHDGLRLPRAFRAAGFRTDLFDATPLAQCRMYSSAAEVWNGLSKNATEGLASRSLIIPMTSILVLGQIVPFLAAFFVPSADGLGWLLWAMALVLSVRLVAVVRFRQPVLGAVLHPIGILILLFIQWRAFIRKSRGIPEKWKDRSFIAVHESQSL